MTRRPSRALLWFGVVGAPLAWAAQEWAGWFFASAPCRALGAQAALPSRAPQFVLHALVLLVGLAALGASLRGRAGTQRSEREAPQLDRFLATAGLIISALGLVALVWGSLGTFLLAPCEAMR